MSPPRPRLDWARIGKHADELSQQIVNRGNKQGAELVRALLAAREAEQATRRQVEAMQAQRNKAVVGLREQISALKTQLVAQSSALDSLAMSLPNWTHPETPVGSEDHAVVVRSSSSSSTPTSSPLHIPSRLLDMESAVTTTGTRFAFLKNELALCELGLVQLAINRLYTRGFTPVSTPDLVKPWLLEACGFQPRGEATQTYHITGHDLCLTGTAEVPLAGMFAGKTLKDPVYLAGFGHCFRTEAGASGAKQKGMYRLHQFTKVEMFIAARPEDSNAEFDRLVNEQVAMCELMQLRYRVLNMPTEELGCSAYRKFDVEVWMPASGRWGEVASITNCQDFQARRLDCKMGAEFAHTLNGTAMAVPRMLLAIVETHVDGKGVVKLPGELARVVGIGEVALS
jgi:seryl-tRNA synthetase